MKKLVLASSSPRRAELLRQIGLNFEIITSDVDETLLPGLSPPEQVEYLARKKAEAVAREVNSGIDGIVIAADTIVVWQEQILGKPLDGEEAFAILSRLQGSAHDVFTGIALVDTHTGGVLTGHEQTRVFLRAIEEDEIRRYIDSVTFGQSGSVWCPGFGSNIYREAGGLLYQCGWFTVGQAFTNVQKIWF